MMMMMMMIMMILRSLIVFELTDRISEGLQKVSASIGVGMQPVMLSLKTLSCSKTVLRQFFTVFVFVLWLTVFVFVL